MDANAAQDFVKMMQGVVDGPAAQLWAEAARIQVIDGLLFLAAAVGVAVLWERYKPTLRAAVPKEWEEGLVAQYAMVASISAYAVVGIFVVQGLRLIVAPHYHAALQILRQL